MKDNTLQFKAVFLAAIGTVIEWAEYVFYGYMAIKLSSLFFPEGHPTLNLLKTFGVFAAGYLMRPAGALFFGYLGDVYGRKSALMYSMLLMGFATLGIGLLPTYAQAGAMAPVLLLFLRLLQGLAVSGEYNGAAIFVIEHSKENACFKGSFIAASAAFGMVIGGLAAFVVSLPGMPEWAYRVPFLLGGIGCLLALWLRNNLSDSDEFIEAKQNKTNTVSLLDLFSQHKTGFMRVAAIAAFTGIFVYIGNVYFVVFLKQLGYELSTATLIALLGQLGVTIGIPIMGYIAGKRNPYQFYCNGLILTACTFPLLYLFANTMNPYLLVTGVAIYAITNAWLSGPLMSILQDQFPTLVRYRGISLAWGISVALFGGTSLMIAQSLQDVFQVPYACSLYVSASALLTWFLLKSCEQPSVNPLQANTATVVS